MNIYKMKDKDLTKYSTKFNKTVFGKRAKIFATTPIVLGFVFIILLIYQMISNPSNISFDNSTITILSICFLTKLLLASPLIYILYFSSSAYLFCIV